MPPENFALLLILGVVNHQVAHIITVGVVFDDLRRWVKARNGKLGYLASCHLCCGTWIGFAEAAVAKHRFDFTGNGVVDFFLLAFTVALLGRATNELLALMACKVSNLQRRTDALAPDGPPPSIQRDSDDDSQEAIAMANRKPFAHFRQDVPADDAPQLGAIIQEGVHKFIVKTIIPQDCDGTLVACELFPLAWEHGRVADQEYMADALDARAWVLDIMEHYYGDKRRDCA